MDFLIAGLGNPGVDYRLHRHNVGFQMLDHLVSFLKFPPFKAQQNCLTTFGVFEEKKIVIAKPLLYMNLSGRALSPLLKFYKMQVEALVVIHDDLALPCGTVKYKFDGGNAGHNGLKDIDMHLGKNYHRLRIGIDHPLQKNAVSQYVLSPFRQAEREVIDNVFERIKDALPLFLQGQQNLFLQKLSSSV